jgi:hypothetical protein
VYYSVISPVVHSNPRIIDTANIAVGAGKEQARNIANQNSRTMGWRDVLTTWAFETNDCNPMKFDSDAATTKDVSQMQGVAGARDDMTRALRAGAFGKLEVGSPFGIDEAFADILDPVGNRAVLFLGSCNTAITPAENDDGTITLNFDVQNATGRASASRYRDGPPGEPNLGIFSDAKC